MPDFRIEEVDETPYFYVERACSMDPKDISTSMGSAFQQVWSFMKLHDVTSNGPAISVYYDYSPDEMKFRAGFVVAREDMAKVSGDIKSDTTPNGRALHFVHKGPYATLRDDYELMMTYIQDQGLVICAPSWELYMNDPQQVAEEELKTGIYTMLA